KRVHLELGGKAPVIVFDDADLSKAVEWIRIGGYFNAGQDCTAATRVLAGPHIQEKLLADLVSSVKSLKVGDPLADDTEMGPQASVRHGVDQHSHPARQRDASRRLQAERLRQGHVGLLARGVHAAQARDGVPGLIWRPRR